MTTFRMVPTHCVCCGHRISLDLRIVEGEDGLSREASVYVCREGCFCTLGFCMPDRSEHP